MDNKKVAVELKNGIFVSRPVNTTKLKSDYWKNFERIYDDSGKPIDFIRCSRCKIVLTHSKTTGTNVLKNHKCTTTVLAAEQTKPLSHFLPVLVPNDVKDQFTHACVHFVASDLRPYNIVNGKGFQELIQKTLDIAGFKKYNADALIPERRVVARKAQEIASNTREALKEHLTKNIVNNRCAMTTDMWTDNFRKFSYLTLTVHYIDESWNLQERVLATRLFTEEKKTGANILADVEAILRQFGFSSWENVVFVTDRGANMLAAFKENNSMPCSAHILNTVLSTTFKKEKLQIGILHPVLIFLDQCRELVGYFKRSGKASKLTTSLAQVVDTRWNTHHSMLVSIKQNYNIIKMMLAGSDEEYRVAGINIQMLDTLIGFLTPFKEVSDIFEASKKPTLHHVVVYRQYLITSLETNANDPSYLSELKKVANGLLVEKLKLGKLHRMALFLNPKFRSMKPLTISERETTILDIQELMDSHVFSFIPTAEELQPSTSGYSADHGYSTNETGSKRQKLVSSVEIWEDDISELPPIDHLNELHCYRTMDIGGSVEEDFNILSWWKTNSSKLPRLSQIAKYVLSVPASSAPSERSFSVAGLTVNKLRSKLNPKNVDDLCFLRSNIDLVI